MAQLIISFRTIVFLSATVTLNPSDADAKGNSSQVHHLFQNLIENSLKFSIKGKPVKISTTARSITSKGASIPLPSGEWNNPFYQIVVKDNGIGLTSK